MSGRHLAGGDGGFANWVDPEHGSLPHAAVFTTRASSAGHNNLGSLILAVGWSTTAVATVFLSARLYVKLRLRRGVTFWWDDAVLVASWVMLVSCTAVATFGVSESLGTHVSDISQDDSSSMETPLQLSIVIGNTLGIMGAAWSKTSFAITLLRLTRGQDRKAIPRLLWAIIVTLNIVMVFNVILQFIWCQPAWAVWHEGKGGTCWDKWVYIDYSISAAGYSALMDFTLALIPWLIIMRLNMGTGEKIGVAICMSLGPVAGVTSVLRAVDIPTIYSEDYSYVDGKLFVWTGAEISTTICAASIPPLRGLLHSSMRKYRMTPSRMSRSRSRGNTVGSLLQVSSQLKDGMGRTQGYRNLQLGATGRAPPTSRRKSSPALSVIEEISDVAPDAPPVPDPVHHRPYGKRQGVIVKTERIEVHYEPRRKQSAEAAGRRYQSFELDELDELDDMNPLYEASATRSDGV